MAKRKKHSRYKITTVKIKRKKTSMSLSIIGLILNVLVIPGLGSLINSRIKAGVWQIVLFVIGAIGMYFAYTFSGILVLASWVWGLVTGIKMIQESR